MATCCISCLVEPLEIKCIQGGSGDRDIDEDDCFEVPEDVDSLYHATLYRHVKPILDCGGVYCGGARGESQRNRIYVSCMDWEDSPSDYVPPEKPFTAFRYEPYPPRSDWQVKVRLDYKTCRELGGKSMQTESLAGVGPKSWNAPTETIEEVTDCEGWVLYRRPPPLSEPFSLWSDEARGNPERQNEALRQRYPRCTHPGFGASYPRGLVYCFDCHRVLEGAIEHNIHRDKRGETQRGDESEIAEIKNKVKLQVRRLDDPAGPMRGARQVRRVPPCEAFKNYCAEILKRTTAEKGVRLEDDRIVHFADSIDCFRERCEGPNSDPRYFGQIRDHVEKKFSAELEGEPFSHEFMKWMYLVGKERRDNPQESPMSYAQRSELLAGRHVVSSDQHATTDSIPLNQLPHYHSMRATASRASDPEKGKGKGKGKGKKGKQDWVYRHGDNRPYW